MAKRKSGSRGSARRPWLLSLLRFMFLTPARWFIMAGVIVGIAYWQWSAITAWVTRVANAIATIFGWGLLIAILAFAVFVGLVWTQKLSSFRRWGYWLGSLAVLAAIWGMLAFFGIGGRIGLSIAGGTNFLGGLRLFGIILLGILLIAPVASFQLGKRFLLWAWGRFKKEPAPPTPAGQTQISPLELPGPTELEPVQKPSAAFKPGPAARELKQVARDVWKKYGEAPGLVTVDGWRLPPIDILDLTPEVQLSQADNLQRAKVIEEALTSYGVEGKVVQINAGPTVTQFGIEPGWDRKMKDIKEKDKNGNVTVRQEEVSRTRVKVERITSLANDLALALAASSIRIEAPVPGKSVVGVEVPNTVSSAVSLRSVIESNAFQKSLAKSKMTLALGKGAGGEAVAADLTKMPHLLIAGATGSGKTVCLNTIICGLLLNNTPNDVRFVMVDPKRVELTSFNSIPHLAAPVIVDAEKAIEALRWLNSEMDKRYRRMAEAGARNIEAYNKNRQGDQKMPFLVLVIDELADLMMTAGDEVERILCRLAQLARAIGIHLVVATQRPSVDVITGLIKANFPTRISFAVTSQVDSRTILDGAGAEKLLGKGDMLYMPTDAAKPKRLQGCYVSDPETERLVYFWGSQQRQEGASLRLEPVVQPNAPPMTAPVRAPLKTEPPEDGLLETARQLAKEHKRISASFLQRQLRIGYPRAAKLVELLEAERGSAPAANNEDGEDKEEDA